MKKLLSIYLLFSQFCWSQNAFEKGNNLYQKGQYQEAIVQYESILKGGQESAEIYFNLGNCFYKLNKVAPAIYNFERALKLSPNDTEIQNNLAFAQKMAIDEVQEVPQVGFSKIIVNFTSIFHYDAWAWISIVLALLFLISFIGYYFSETTFLKRLFFSVMAVMMFFILISLLAGFYEQNRITNIKPAIVFADTVNVKSEPNPASQNAFVLHAGTKVFILEDLSDFYKIQLTDLKEGWIEKNTIKEIN